jgi:hypothetical protein
MPKVIPYRLPNAFESVPSTPASTPRATTTDLVTFINDLQVLLLHRPHAFQVLANLVHRLRMNLPR